MREAVICSPLRTPVGRYGGSLRDVDAEALAETVVRVLIERTKLDPSVVDDCIFGQCYPTMESPAIGRIAALAAGLPIEVPGFQVDRRCASGLQAICLAAMEVQTDVADVVIAGGVESMSTANFYSTAVRWGPNRGVINLVDSLNRGRATAGSRRYPVPGGMLETAENVRRKHGIPRQEQDEYSLRSHQRAVAAGDTGKFDAEIVPVTVPGKGKGSEAVIFDRDEHPRRDTTLEKLASLRAVLAKQDPDATVTAGNASGENDAAACCIVTSPEKAAELGLEPMGKLRSWAAVGVHPEYMGMGPVPATKKALERAGLSLSDMGLIELNEAFAVQVLACTREWGFTERDFERMNVNGSGIALGHPLGATGARIMATLLFEMERRDIQFGLETMCVGGGQGMAAVIERMA
jgi:acetyl-CoA C-acetyltransferase